MIIRPATPADAPAMTALQNEIIAIGGTTAYQRPRHEDEVREDYITAPEAVYCHVALDDDGTLLGFQALGRWPGLPAGWADIGTFVTPARQRSGAGAALFAATAAAARAAGIATINATIRADNVPGLGYYARRGFIIYATDPDWALDDGRVVGRVSKRFDL
ncbi:GNAT family N-acetyltransferase [Neotabrizicola shimadae]|uniref:GNAT family N-acetyltransferase n=1 Tax=Neotabrizicola shimadae TaxID=2807096 RepID=A0A8G1ECC3_9RHOB|nr:GNAT family N-acetyltransferase [Neotabrizicola shimadae]QYZ68923.1 GNAT family N-acetyltransferase [Neotabrizicola shimadae]